MGKDVSGDTDIVSKARLAATAIAEENIEINRAKGHESNAKEAIRQ